MAGIYIHIPFCKSRCAYCGFYSTTRLELRQRYVDAVCREMERRSLSLPPTPIPDLCSQSPTRSLSKGRGSIGTIYLGGGTPSQLTIPQLHQLFKALYYIYKVENDAEVTIECNPDDITTNFAEALAQFPVNRVSMGAQTFDDRRLRFLNRRHTSDQVPLAVERLRQAGIRNISIDLMYGFPDETLDDWQHDIDAALALDVEHLSAYSLMYEEGTTLYRQLQQGLIAETDEELSLQMYDMLIDRLTAAGYEHYEISNFARPGYRSRHNSSYWTDVPYIGLGAAAHSYDLKSRYWNVDDIEQYIKGIETGVPVVEREEIDAQTRYNDRVMLSLRTCEGLDLSLLSPDERSYCLEQASPFLSGGELCLRDGRLVLTRRGLFVSDMVMSRLMQV